MSTKHKKESAVAACERVLAAWDGEYFPTFTQVFKQAGVKYDTGYAAMYHLRHHKVVEYTAKGPHTEVLYTPENDTRRYKILEHVEESAPRVRRKSGTRTRAPAEQEIIIPASLRKVDPLAVLVDCKPEGGDIDPHGYHQHTPGAKLDGNKLRPSLVFGGFPRALDAVIEIATYGARKYTDNGWSKVPNGVERYTDAFWRHLMAIQKGEEIDPESGLSHWAHIAWNVLARMELDARRHDGA